MTVSMLLFELPVCSRMAALPAEVQAAVMGVSNDGAPPGVPVS